ncbi:MAG: beta-phosphoglucomutase [Anaerolineaceae bacterium]|nr:beta-phosphoglucomutase [Anaerolineaceae bacterium]
MVKAFIFDLDGVIVNTAEFHYRAWKRLADEECIPFSRELNEELRGVSRRESLNRLLNGQKINESQAQEWMDRKNEYYLNALSELSPLDILPGVKDLLDELRLSEIKVSLASSSKNALGVIRKLGIEDYFDVICDGNSVDNAKPAPDVFIYAAQQLRVKQKDCLVIEDAAAGIMAANAADMFSIGIGSPERLQQATIIFPNFVNIHLEDILKKLEFYSKD